MLGYIDKRRKINYINLNRPIIYRCDRSIGTNHQTDPKGHGDQDNRCLFWHCYRWTTLYNWTKCFSKLVADGDKRGWHYTG